MQKLKGNQLTPKMATMCLVHLEEESAKRDEDGGSEDPNSINGVTEEFMVHLVRAVKDAKWGKSTAIIVAAPNTLSVTVH